MEQRDYLKKQIDQLGQVLAKIFSDLLGLKNSGQINAGLEITSQALKNELDIDIQALLDIFLQTTLLTYLHHKRT